MKIFKLLFSFEKRKLNLKFFQSFSSSLKKHFSLIYLPEELIPLS